MAEAKASEPRDPDAIALATVDPDGMPNVRMVLLKGWGPEGFVFYTNRESAKGRELEGQEGDAHGNVGESDRQKDDRERGVRGMSAHDVPDLVR